MEPKEILVQLKSVHVPVEDEKDDEPATEEGREDT